MLKDGKIFNWFQK